MKVLVASALISAPFGFLIFTCHSAPALLAGVVMWGIGMGARYDVNLLLMASVSAASQLLAIPFYILSSKSNLTKK